MKWLQKRVLAPGAGKHVLKPVLETTFTREMVSKTRLGGDFTRENARKFFVWDVFTRDFRSQKVGRKFPPGKHALKLFGGQITSGNRFQKRLEADSRRKIGSETFRRRIWLVK